MTITPRMLLLVATLALAACATPPYGTSLDATPRGAGTGGTQLHCGPGVADNPPCEVRVSMRGGRVLLQPDIVNVHFDKGRAPVRISWILDRAAVADGFSFRRASSVFFKNLEPDDDNVLGSDQPDAKFAANAGTSVVHVLDRCSKRCDGELYNFQIIVYDARGVAHVSEDPGVKNHPS